MITLKKSKYTKKSKNTKKSKHTKKSKYTSKNTNYNTKIAQTSIKQYGSSILNKFAGQVFSNTGKRNLTVSIPGSQFVKKTKKSIKYLQNGKSEDTALLSIFYNYRTPYQININKATLNTIYQSGRLMIAPHIQINNHNRFLLVMILPNIKPKLLWALNFNNRSKLDTIISYLIPQHPINQIFKLVFKLYRYQEHVITKFAIKDSMVIKRRKAFRKLNNYVNTNKMMNSVVALYTINVIQDKGDSMSKFFSL